MGSSLLSPSLTVSGAGIGGSNLARKMGGACRLCRSRCWCVYVRSPLGSLVHQVNSGSDSPESGPVPARAAWDPAVALGTRQRFPCRAACGLPWALGELRGGDADGDQPQERRGPGEESCLLSSLCSVQTQASGHRPGPSPCSPRLQQSRCGCLVPSLSWQEAP